MNDSCVDDYRILALVEYKSSHALFVLWTKKQKPNSISDLSFESAIPIDADFSCGTIKDFNAVWKYKQYLFLDTESIDNCRNYLIFVVTHRTSKLSFKIRIGVESANFASELTWSKEGKWEYI